jgi:hypothetical protein
MAKRSQHSFLKRQKEMKRKDRAAEKMAIRHGKSEKLKNRPEEEEQQETPAPAGTNDETGA